jgi:hypothetical protein
VQNRHDFTVLANLLKPPVHRRGYAPSAPDRNLNLRAILRREQPSTVSQLELETSDEVAPLVATADRPAGAVAADRSAGTVAAEPADMAPDERRITKRLPYASLGMVAPYDGLEMPPDNLFWIMQCRDLSRGGVGFYSPIKPSTPNLVVSLGVVGGVSCVIACRVVHCSQVYTQGACQYLVGCEFLQRLDS